MADGRWRGDLGVDKAKSAVGGATMRIVDDARLRENVFRCETLPECLSA